MKFDPSTFWNNKILQWEKDKYFTHRTIVFSFDVNSSIKKRIELARTVLKDSVSGRTVLELGCGSALLMEDILSFGAKKYIGVDISATAINAAKSRVSASENSSKVELINKNITELPPMKADICFSLGLFDWLKLEDISMLHEKTQAEFYFHTFSEKKKFSLTQIFHRVYVYFMYGHRNNRYVPQYHSEDEITKALNPDLKTNSHYFRHPELSFGCLVYKLPRPIEEIK